MLLEERIDRKVIVRVEKETFYFPLSRWWGTEYLLPSFGMGTEYKIELEDGEIVRMPIDTKPQPREGYLLEERCSYSSESSQLSARGRS